MNEVTNAFAKLAGTLKATNALLDVVMERGRNERRPHLFSPRDAQEHFNQTARQLEILRNLLPDLYFDFPNVDSEGDTPMTPPNPNFFGRGQVERLARTIDQIFEIRANSELSSPKSERPRRVFISHGRATDWRELQAHVERDIGVETMGLAQEPNLGRTVIEKLSEESDRCSYAVIVMTGDDLDADGVVRARENVLHEIGFFQAKFGLAGVCLLHEDGTNIPSNIGGVVYVPFTKGTISMTFGTVLRELKAFYRL